MTTPHMDPFAFYGIKRQFFLDDGELRRSFLRKSRLLHPDHMAGALAAAQEKALELSGLNNSAYETLKDFHLRLRCILDLEGVLQDEGQAKLPQEFLMEMMDLNEALMELEADPSPAKASELQKLVSRLERENLEMAHPTMEAYDLGESVDLGLVNDYYLKHKYLARFTENLEKAAP